MSWSARQYLPALVAKLAPGGALAIQKPDNLDDPAHRLMRETAADGPWAPMAAAAARAYPALPDGSVLLPFPRLFVVASR